MILTSNELSPETAGAYSNGIYEFLRPHLANQEDYSGQIEVICGFSVNEGRVDDEELQKFMDARGYSEEEYELDGMPFDDPSGKPGFLLDIAKRA